LLHNHPHLSSGASTIGQKWSQYKGLSPTPLTIKKKRPYFRILADFAQVTNFVRNMSKED
jgi:hypothetical protein